jgi:hypothetical protein
MPETVQDVPPPFIAVGYTDKVVFTQAEAQEPLNLRTTWQESVKIPGARRTTLHHFQDEQNFQTTQGWQWRSAVR